MSISNTKKLVKSERQMTLLDPATCYPPEPYVPLQSGERSSKSRAENAQPQAYRRPPCPGGPGWMWDAWECRWVNVYAGPLPPRPVPTQPSYALDFASLYPSLMIAFNQYKDADITSTPPPSQTVPSTANDTVPASQ
jgi:hypothetical protein